MSNGQTQTTPTKTQDIQQILNAISKVLEGVQSSKDSGAGPSTLPGFAPPPPPSTIQFRPQGAPTAPITTGPTRPTTLAEGMQPTGSQSIGEFQTHGGAVNAGLVSLGNSLSSLFGAVERKEQAKKAALAENYLLQINSLLASGDPEDRKKAEMFLEDSKIRKILKQGLEYTPLEEEVPPEAHGVASAVQKIQKGQTGQQPRPQMRPVLPQAPQQDQVKAAITSAILQKLQQDPASAISMAGGSQLSAADQHAAEFYERGLGLSPSQVGMLTAQEKLQGLKLYEGVIRDVVRADTDLEKTRITAGSRVDAANIMANARKYVGDKVKEAWEGRDKKRAGSANVTAAAKIYEDYAKKYLDLVKGGKGPDGKPLTAEQIKDYQGKADSYQQKAEDYLNQAGDADLMNLFMGALGGDEEPSKEEDQP